MRHLLVFLSVFALLPANAQADEALARRRMARRALLDHHLPVREGGLGRPDSTGAYDVQAVRVETDLSDAGVLLSAPGHIVVELQAGPAPMDELVLLSFFFRPDTVRRPGGPPLRQVWDPQTGELRITLDQRLLPGRMLTLEMDGAFGGYCLDASSCIEDGPFRHLVEFGWYPLNAEFPVEDRFALELVLRAPARLTVAATGSRSAPERDGTALIWRYRTERPAVLGALAIGPFDIQPIDQRIEVFVPPDQVDNGGFLGATAQAAVAFYSDLLGPYPFSRLGIAPIADEAGVGLGPQAQVLLPAVFWLVSERQEESALVREVATHEIGHQYFFNLVGVVDAAEGWMSEAFAEYAATRFSETVTGTTDHARLNYWEYVLTVDEVADVPLNSEAAGVADPAVRLAVVYDKGSAVLHQLRSQLPDFDGVFRRYIERFAGEIVTTRDFQRFLEAATGRAQGPYFDQWVRGTGFPRLQVHVVRPRDNAAALEVQVKQLPGRHGPFTATVPLRGHLADGSTVEEVVAIEREVNGTQLGAAQWLELDPDLTLFRRIQAEPASDVNLSGVVDGMDLLDLHAHQGRATPDPAWSDALDANRDQIIDERDLRAALEAFGQGW